ncbi:MAG: UDP-N-acetylmuramoyl-L-alanine--D-glutamate ligase [Pseudomonadota bacterium]|nr:UDP-N-acetylmuramoyl-L-alanine--D-glutamate ligase [Pseudomonadota bacterium]
MSTAADRSGEAVVLGMGPSGLSCARHLAGSGWRVCAMDTRDAPPDVATFERELPQVDVRTGGFDAARAAAAALLAVSPGIAADAPVVARARAAGVDVAGDIELFARATDARIAGISGTNGKSTVTSLLGEMLRAEGMEIAVGGNLGEPALELLARAPGDGYVLELSSFQLDLVTRLPLACAALLNLSVDHLDRYGSMEAYAASKRRIYRHARVAVFDADDPRIRPDDDFGGRRVHLRARSAPRSGEWGLRGRGDALELVAGNGRRFPARDLPIAGRHNAFNVLAALAMAEVMGADLERSWGAALAYAPLPHRCVPVAEFGGVRWVNDSKATNVGACRAALEGLGDGARRLVLLAGGLGKGADFLELRASVAASVRALVLFGEDAPAIAEAVGDLCPHEFVDDMPSAVRAARAFASLGDTVLLAPACASFDQYASFGARGDAFVDAVRALERECAQ